MSKKNTSTPARTIEAHLDQYYPEHLPPDRAILRDRHIGSMD